jgi:acyl dehydratase
VTPNLTDLRQYVGDRCGPFYAWDAVNAPMIRHWCEAMGDHNPIYTDTEAARRAGYAQRVAPPAMLQAWGMTGFSGERAAGSGTGSALAVLQVLEAAGYPGVVAVNCEQEYQQYLEEGDRVYYMAELESISEEKATALGFGYFCTELSTYYNQRDEQVGTMRFRVFKYRPHAQDA